MIWKAFKGRNAELLEQLGEKRLSPLDLIPQEDMREKLVELVVNGVPELAENKSSHLFRDFVNNIHRTTVNESKVVVFGGGTGLSNIIGGDSRQKSWVKEPFVGIKQIFPHTTAVVCVTDDGGSTGELLKDIPLIAIGDIRHVLLSSIQQERLAQKYGLSSGESIKTAAELFSIFNFRFQKKPQTVDELLAMSEADFSIIPQKITDYVRELLAFSFSDSQCLKTMGRPQCLGNIIVMSALMRTIRREKREKNSLDIPENAEEKLIGGLCECAETFGAGRESVLPSTLTPAQLRFLYTNGVEVSGEKKSSEAQRGYPVERVFVDFSGKVSVPGKVLSKIAAADILLMAPGSLYSSIIPVFQVQEIAEAVRQNRHALKLLIANLWVQAGETDKSISDPERKFHISDMIRAYDRNLPGGTEGLFDKILCLSLKDIPQRLYKIMQSKGRYRYILIRIF